MVQVLLRAPAVLDGDSRPEFYELSRQRAPPCAHRPFVERKRLLRRLVRPPLLYVDDVARRGVDLFHTACAQD